MLNSPAWHVNLVLHHMQTYRMHSGAKARKKVRPKKKSMEGDKENGGMVQSSAQEKKQKAGGNMGKAHKYRLYV